MCWAVETHLQRDFRHGSIKMLVLFSVTQVLPSSLGFPLSRLISFMLVKWLNSHSRPHRHTLHCPKENRTSLFPTTEPKVLSFTLIGSV